MKLIKHFWVGRLTFFSYLRALLTPGHPPRSRTADPNVVADVTAWPAADLTLLLEEGRRQYDRLDSGVGTSRTRAQFTFTTALALLVVMGTEANTASVQPIWLHVFFLVGGGFVVLGLMGSLAVALVQIGTETIHVPILTNYPTPIRARLAGDYASVILAMQRAHLTMVTVYREASLYVTLGAVAYGGYWLAVVY